MASLQIIFAGAGEFGLPTLHALLDSEHQVVGVITQPDRPAGRGRKLTPTSIAQLALERGLPLTRTQNINAETLPPADVMVVIAFGQKISESAVNHPRLGSVNLHASRLPKFRGAAPIHAAILAGESITGNSIIRLAQKMDAGAVLAMSQINIGELETTGELHDRLAADGAPLMLQLLQQFAVGQVVEASQDESLATLAPKLKRDATMINWACDEPQIARQIRAMHPWPACRVRVLSEDQELARATLVRARRVDAQGESRVGHIEWSGAITTASGALEIIELQPEGGRIMSLAEFRNGHPWRPGLRIESI